MPILPIAIRNKQAVYTGSVPYVCSNSDYEVVFTFDAEWEEHPQKTVRFCAGGQCVERIITGNTCPVPVLDEGAFMQVGVYAGNLQTSTAAMIRMCGSIRSIGGAPAEPEPSVYDQIMEMLESMDTSGSGGVSAEKLKAAVEEALTQAKESGDFKGDKGDPGYTPQKGVDYSPPVVAGMVFGKPRDWRQSAFAAAKPFADNHQYCGGPIYRFQA